MGEADPNLQDEYHCSKMSSHPNAASLSQEERKAEEQAVGAELWGRGYVRGCFGVEHEGKSQRDSSPGGKSGGCWKLQLWM